MVCGFNFSNLVGWHKRIDLSSQDSISGAGWERGRGWRILMNMNKRTEKLGMKSCGSNHNTGRQRQEGVGGGPVYIVSSRPIRVTY